MELKDGYYRNIHYHHNDKCNWRSYDYETCVGEVEATLGVVE